MAERSFGLVLGLSGLVALGCGAKTGATDNAADGDASAGKASLGGTGQNPTPGAGGTSFGSSGLGQGGATTLLGGRTATATMDTNPPGGAAALTAGGTSSTRLGTSGGTKAQLSTNGGAATTTTSASLGGATTTNTIAATGGAGETGEPPIGESGGTATAQAGAAGSGSLPQNQAGTGNLPAFAECFPSSIATPNVVVLGDATPSGADVEGRMWVAGNATFSGFGVASEEPYVGGCSKVTVYGLVVGGDVSGDVNVNDTLIAVYGTNRMSNASSCGVTKEHPVDFTALSQQLPAYSATLATLAPTGTATATGNLVLEGQNSGLNVFQVTAARLVSAGQVKVVAPPGATVLVNVSGDSAIWSGAGFTFPDGASCRGNTSTWCHRVLYNFYASTKLELGGIGVQGSILAPKAALSGSGANVDGQVVVASLAGGIEYHPYLFTGCLRP